MLFGSGGVVVLASALLALTSWSAVGVSGAPQRVEEDTFDRIKNSPGEQMVAFYHGSDRSFKDTLKVLKKTAKKLQHDKPDFKFRKCDCELEVNKKECSEASFNAGTFLFTATQNEGIEKYSLGVNAKTIAEYIRGKSAKYDESDVLEFRNEDAFFERMDNSDEPKPILVKFYEQWCQHCKRARVPFAQGASHFKRKVEFMDVECSKNDDTTSFCTRNGVKSYPTFILFTGERKIPFTAEVRHIMTFGQFFDQHLTTTKPAAAAAGAAAPAAAVPPPIGAFSKPAAAAAAAAAADAPAAATAPASAAAAAAPSGGASSAEVTALQKKVTELESRISKLEAMLKS